MPCRRRRDKNRCETQTPSRPAWHPCFSLANRRGREPAWTISIPRISPAPDGPAPSLLLRAPPWQSRCPRPERRTAACGSCPLPRSQSGKTLGSPVRSADRRVRGRERSARKSNSSSRDKSRPGPRCARCARAARISLRATPAAAAASTVIFRRALARDRAPKRSYARR